MEPEHLALTVVNDARDKKENEVCLQSQFSYPV